MGRTTVSCCTVQHSPAGARKTFGRDCCRHKGWRAAVTRYGKMARNFLAGTCLAAVVTDWLQ